MKRKRITLAWSPTWSSDYEKWTSVTIKKNLWRLDPCTDSQDDLMQEAKILFWKLSKVYPLVQNNAHFFSLYRTSLQRRLIDKANAYTRRNHGNTVDITEVEIHGGDNTGYLNTLLESMPSELKFVLNVLTAGGGSVKLRRPTSTKRPRENANMKIKRQYPALGLVDPVGDLQRVLKYNS